MKKVVGIISLISVICVLAVIGTWVYPAYAKAEGDTFTEKMTNMVMAMRSTTDGTEGAAISASTEAGNAPATEAAETEESSEEATEEASKATESANAAPDDTEPVISELGTADGDTEAVYVNTAGAKPEDAVDEDGYIDDVTEEDVAEWNDALTALDRKSSTAIINHYNDDYWKYDKWADGVYKIEFSWNSMTENDFQRQKSAMKMGLTEKEILDAMDFIFENLTDEQIKKLLKLSFGKDADFSAAEIEDLKVELFQTWLENPPVFRGTLLIMQPLKVGDTDMGAKTISDNCVGLRKYLERYDEALDGGIGSMIMMRDEQGREGKDIPYDYDGTLYVNAGHINAVCQLISFFEAMEFKVGRYHTDDRMHLVSLDYNHLRKAEEINNDEPLLDYWLYADYYLKGSSKRAWRIGFNLGDRSPAILKNTSSVKKPAPVPPVVVTSKKTSQEIIPIGGIIYGTSSTTTTTTYNPNNPYTPYTPPSNNTETKNQTLDPGWGKDDNKKSDSGPGEYKPDQGNSQSDTVAGSQYQQGTSRTDVNNTQPTYDSGPAADNTDNGTAPATAPIETHESHYETTSSSSSGGSDSGSSGGGETADAGSDNGKMSSAPPADDD